MAPTKVLITGVTGFIGGTVLNHLLSSRNPASKDLEISVLTRDDDRAKYFSSLSLKVYTIHDLDDVATITAAAAENDVVIHTASGFHPASAKALIEGLGARKRQDSSVEVYYLHTSGTSNLADHPITKTYLESRTFSDKDSDIYEYLKKREALESYHQRSTDLVVVETGKKEGVPTTVIMSPTIYGIGSGHFNQLTMQYPLLMKMALRDGRAEYIGNGSGVWDFVHVLDLAELYEIVLLDWVQRVRRVPVGEKGFMFSGTGTFTWKEVAEGIARVAVEKGMFKDAKPNSVSLDEAVRKWAGGNAQVCELGLASNSRTRADIGKELGWKPTKTKKDWERSFEDEFDAVLKKENEEGKKNRL